MKKIVICLVLMLSFVGLSNAQTKTMVGTVVRYEGGNSGAALSLKSAIKSISFKHFLLPRPQTRNKKLHLRPK